MGRPVTLLNMTAAEFITRRNRALSEFTALANSEQLHLYNVRGLTLEEMERMTAELRADVPSPQAVVEDLVERLRTESFTSIRALAMEFRPFLERHRGLRADSTRGTALRRFQEFLSTQVYVLLPEEHLPRRVRLGQSAARRRGAQSSRPSPHR